MKIEIPPFRAMAKCNEHLNHNGFSIDLGEDVVQVVRCKDCEYGEDTGEDTGNDYLCHFNGSDWNGGEHFCSYGKRRGEEE